MEISKVTYLSMGIFCTGKRGTCFKVIIMITFDDEIVDDFNDCFSVVSIFIYFCNLIILIIKRITGWKGQKIQYNEHREAAIGIDIMRAVVNDLSQLVLVGIILEEAGG